MAVDIITREQKGYPLSYREMSRNFTNLAAAVEDSTGSAAAALASSIAASASAGTASGSASSASASASAASASAVGAASSASSASASAAAALASLNNFKGVWYGALSVDPTVDPLGNVINAGDAYYNTVLPGLKTYDGTAWNAIDNRVQLAATGGAGLVGFLRSIAGSIGTTVAKFMGWQPLSVYDFMTDAQIADARSGAPTMDHTGAVQTALDSFPKTLNFNADGTFRVGVLNIKSSCKIDGNGCGILASGLGIFNAVVAMPYLEITRFKKISWVAGELVGTTGRQFFWNGNNSAGSTAYGATTSYDINDLRIYNNNLGSSKIECFGLNTMSRVKENIWIHATGVAVAPAYLYIERGTTDDNAGPIYIEENFFSVYPPSIVGASIVKVSGGVTDAQINNNYVRCNNNSCLAEVDVFTGAHKMRFTNNTLIDVQLHRKQLKGSLAVAPSLYQYDLTHGNTFEVRINALLSTPIYFVGALGTISFNQFIMRNNTAIGYAIQFDPSDVDIGFDTNAAVANIINGNIFDLRSSFSGNAAMKFGSPSIGSSGSRYMAITGNIQLGGSYFMSGGSQMFTACTGNVWGGSSSALGISINGSSQNNLMMGNVADTVTPQMTGNTRGNLVTLSIPTLTAGATPNIDNGDLFFVNSGTDITNFTGGYIGKKIILFTGGATTVVTGTNIQLNGSVNFLFDTFGDSLTLVKTTSTRWVEVGRSVN